MARRAGGLVSLSPWCRRFTTPRAWNVCTRGVPVLARAHALERFGLARFLSDWDRLLEEVAR